MEEEVFRIQKTGKNSLIIKDIVGESKLSVYDYRLVGRYQAMSRGVRSFAILMGFFISRFAEKKVVHTGGSWLNLYSLRNDYYNSISEKNIGTPTSRLIAQLKCRKRLIVSGKYRKKDDRYSGNRSISFFLDFQEELNTKIHQIFSNNLPSHFAALASGTLIGAQVQFPAKFKNQLVTTGLIHVVVASGYNLSLVSVYIVSFSKKIFPKKLALAVSLIGIWWYVFLALGSPSIVRAGWMCSISVIANIVGRPYSQFRSLLISVLIMLVIEPLLIVNISFQLSVAATVGVMIFGGKQLVNGNASVQSGAIRNTVETILENFKTTLGANLFTFPIIAFWFGRVSLISILANVVLLWVVPMLMFFSFILCVCVVLFPFFKSVLVLPVFVLCWFFIHGVEMFSYFPGASVDIPHWSFVLVNVFYGALFFCIWIAKVIGKKKKTVKNSFFKRTELIGI